MTEGNIGRRAFLRALPGIALGGALGLSQEKPAQAARNLTYPARAPFIEPVGGGDPQLNSLVGTYDRLQQGDTAVIVQLQDVGAQYVAIAAKDLAALGVCGTGEAPAASAAASSSATASSTAEASASSSATASSSTSTEATASSTSTETAGAAEYLGATSFPPDSHGKNIRDRVVQENQTLRLQYWRPGSEFHDTPDRTHNVVLRNGTYHIVLPGSEFLWNGDPGNDEIIFEAGKSQLFVDQGTAQNEGAYQPK